MTFLKNMMNNLRAAILNWGKPQIPLPRDVWQYLNTFLVVTPGVGERVGLEWGLIVPNRLRPGMLLKSYSARDRPPQQRFIHPRILTMSSLRKPALEETRCYQDD